MYLYTDSVVCFVHGTLNPPPLGIILKVFLILDQKPTHDPHFVANLDDIFKTRTNRSPSCITPNDSGYCLFASSEQ